MTYIKLNEQNQTIEHPPINKDNICNYNVATDLLEVDGYVNIEQSLIDLFNQGKGKIENNTIIDISQTPEYIAEQEVKAKAIQDAKTITKRQLLFWLFLNKNIKEANILTAISTIEDVNNRYLGEISYNGTNNFQYGNPFVSVIGQALGLTTQDLIKCFDEAINL